MKKSIKHRCCLLLAILAGMLGAIRPAAAGSLEPVTFQLTQSTPAYLFWTTPPAERVFKDSAAPSSIGSEIRVYAAGNEFEPFQIVVRPAASTSVTVSSPTFGAGIETELYQVDTVPITTPTDYFGRTGDNPDPLWPLADGAVVNLTAGQNTSFWFSIHIPAGTPAGDYPAEVMLGGVSLPVVLHVFNFTLPEELHVKSQLNVSYETILNSYGVSGTGVAYWDYVDKIKQFFIDHRLTPKSVLWSGGLTGSGGAPYIDYDCAGTLTDNDGIWGFEDPAERYLNGNGLMQSTFAEPFNEGTGFPSFMALTFRNNDASADQRPDSFCGHTRSSGDWYLANNPGTAYNQKWFSYITAIRDYLNSLNHLEKAYYYFANEPQDQADYDAVAWYAQQLKIAAPDLKLMVSEEPKPQIYSHPVHTGAKIDIWLAHLGLEFDPAVSFDRQANHNEETWIYFLHGTRLPRFNPLTIDHPGIEGRLTGWFLWKYRLRGIAYYQFNNWSANPWTSPRDYDQNGNRFLIYPPAKTNTPIGFGANGHRFVSSIRLEMIRDGLEDYEYFRLLAGGNQPQPFQDNPADAQVDKVIGDTVAYSRDSTFLYNLRRVIGQKLGGEIASIPNLAPPSAHPRSDGPPGNYYINFQDPAGEPSGAVVYNDHTYLKIGDDLYDSTAGYGWTKAAEVPDSDFYPSWDQWIDAEPKQLLGSSVIDSWGRQDVFEFDLPNGRYSVTACAGSRSSPRYQNIAIEGVVFMDDEQTNNSWITRTKNITVRDKKLTVVMGTYQRIGYINYLDIESAEVTGDANCDGTADLADVITILLAIGGQTPDLSTCTALPGDTNEDGRLGLEDALWLLDKLVDH